MGYSGSLGEIDFATALQVLCRAGRSGILSVHGTGGTCLAILDAGKILFASSDRVPPLGQRFLDAGLLTQKQLDHALAEQRRRVDKPLLGTVLVKLGYLTAAEAAPLVEDHIVAALQDTLSWEEAHVHFDECQGPAHAILRPDRGDVDTLLLRATLNQA